MGEGRKVAGLDTAPPDLGGANEKLAPRGVFISAGPLDTQDAPEELGAIPKCDKCVLVLDLSARTSTPAIHGKGTTLALLKKDLDTSQGNHWGRGGGELTLDSTGSVKAGQSFTVTIRGQLINRIPEWDDRSSATTTAQAEWDRFIAKLNAHEECHVEIAKKAFQALQADYPGTKITEVNAKFLKAKADLQAKQDELDDANHTDSGTKSGVACGDALLNASIV
jgi:hypothetical protein